VQRNVRGILSKLPKTLDETYERVLRDIHEDNKEHARRLLHCLAFAIRPLLVEELAEMLTFDFDAAEGGIPVFHADWRWKDQEEAVLSTCSSLITIAEYDDPAQPYTVRMVQFSHFTVKEFLMSNRLATSIKDVSQYHILPGPAHTILAQACLGYLLQLNDYTDTRGVKDFPLAKYAAEHWVAHAQFQGVASHVKCGMKDLFDSHKPHFASWVGIHNIDGSPFLGYDKLTLLTPLYYSALVGFHELAEHLAIKHPQHVNAISGLYDSPLVAALSRRHFRVADLLLEHGGNVNFHGTRGRTPLHTVLRRNHHEDQDNRVVRFLLERGADVNARDEGHQTPLHILCHDYFSYNPNDILTVARLLLQRGADVNAQDKAHKTPLHLAMRRYYTPNIIRILLEHGADPNLKNEEGKTPLHKLLGPQRRGRDSNRPADYILVVAQLLLEHGADVHARDNDHKTPLLLAVRHRMSNIERFLLEHGADTAEAVEL